MWIGDINSDGFTDLIGLFNTDSSESLPILLINDACPNAYEEI